MSGPGFLSKAALTTARIAYKPAEIPTHMTVSAATVGETTHKLIGTTNAAIKESYDALQPKGPMKLLDKVFDRVDKSLGTSAGKAQRNVQVFWAPMSQGAAQVGQAVVSPLVYRYAKSAGFPDPGDPKLINDLLHTKGYPGPSAEGPPPEAPPAAGPPAEGPPAEGPPAEAPAAAGPPAEGPPPEAAPAPETPPQQ